MYKCVCGREFDNRQAFNGHQGHCKIHLGDDRYQKNLEINREKQQKATKAQSDKCKALKEQNLNQWISEQHRCENCGKIMTEKFASGRFCSEFCYHSYVVKNQPESAKQIRLKALTKGRVWTPDRIAKKYTPEERLTQSIRVKRIMNNPEIRKRISEASKGKHPSEETRKKLSEKTKASFKDGRNRGWVVRSNRESPNEAYWRKVLDDNNILYQQEVKVNKPGSGCYRLDFLIDGHIDLEIDGKQHNYSDRKLSDARRDEYLKSKGYLVYRVKISNSAFFDMNEEVSKFLIWYKSISKKEILDVYSHQYVVLSHNEETQTIIVTPENQDSEEAIVRWIKFLIENNYPQYLDHIFNLPKEVEEFLMSYRDTPMLWGEFYNDGIIRETLYGLCPISIKKDDLESVGVTFIYKQSLKYFDEV